MFDLITIVTQPLPDDKINHIVWRNGLQPNSKNGVVFYDNESTKNLKQQRGVYIRVETDRRLRIEGSLHKFFNEISGNERNNYNKFTMSDAKEAIVILLHEKGVDMEDAYIDSYEIGLNLNVSTDCRLFLGKIRSIGSFGREREFYINPKYVNPMHRKNERVKVTGFSGVRKYYKVYDKVYECIDKKRKIIPEGNILRIETVYKRLDKCKVIDFFSSDNLKKMVEVFFRDWRTIQFELSITTPKNFGRAKKSLCMEILNKGSDEVLRQAKERHVVGSLTDWEYRNIREFINDEWDEVKNRITLIHSEEESEFRELMQIKYSILRYDEINK